MGALKRQCEYRRSANGKRCKSYPRTNDRFCFFHSAETVHAREKARRAGGIARSGKAKVLPNDGRPKQLRTDTEVSECLSETIKQVRVGPLDLIGISQPQMIREGML
jgi:hypothetical protein